MACKGPQHGAGEECLQRVGHLSRVTQLIVGGALPWGLVGAGLHFLERWDVAAPHGAMGAGPDLGTPAERNGRRRCVAICASPYAPELLFIRQSEAGEELLRVWREEALGDERLAFAGARLVKPLLCALPCNWLVMGKCRPIQHASMRAPGPVV